MNNIYAISCAFLLLSNYSQAGNAIGMQTNIIKTDAPDRQFLITKLAFFDAVFEEDKVSLNWGTLVEINNDYFTVQKSNDGITFETVTIVEGAGNSSTSNNYHAKDESPYIGCPSYYRLKQTDYDGNATYSDIKSVTINSRLSFDIYPNPSINPIISFKNASDNTEVTLTAYNVAGELVRKELIIMNNAGNNIIVLDPEMKLSPGVYTVIATSATDTFTKKLVINH
jgi:hypothetical protein